MDRLLKLLDLSLIATAASGFLYMLGYRYLSTYYGSFGLNLQVRDPDTTLVLSQGFDFVGWFILVVFIAFLAFVIASYVTKFFLPRIKIFVNPTLLPSIVGLAVAIGTFIVGYDLLDRFIRHNAQKNANVAIETRRNSANATVQLASGQTMQGNLRLFFFSKDCIVLLDFSPTINVKRPLVAIVPRSELRSVITASPLFKTE